MAKLNTLYKKAKENTNDIWESVFYSKRKD
jgi:hypothetical protein